MRLNEYQAKASETADYPDVGNNTNYTMVGLAGEAGELLNKWKKVLRGDNIHNGSIGLRNMLKKELGDVLWYLSQTATELDMTLEDIAISNLAKLAARKESGSIKGSGDDR